jgi:hypothetical protein
MGIKSQLQAYKQKYYLNKAVRGAMLWIAGLLSLFLLINAVEFGANFNESVRSILFFSFLLLTCASAYWLWVRFLILRRQSHRQISNETVAKEIGRYFPQVSDKLLNLLQLEELNSAQEELLMASIKQKTDDLIHISFVRAIDLNDNRKYIKYILPPAVAIILALIFVPQLITKSTERLINFNTAYLPEAPFEFYLEQNDLLGFSNEPLKLNISTKGNVLPEEVFLDIQGRRVKAMKESNDLFSYTFDRLTNDISFYITGGGVVSNNYKIKVVDRPSLSSFRIILDFPAHTRLTQESIQNSGNLTVPEGTNIKWELNTINTQNADIELNTDSYPFDTNGESYIFDSSFYQNTSYKLKLYNDFSQNRDSLSFEIKVVKDLYPKINVEQYQDTILYQDIVFAGELKDDYGFRSLRLLYAYDNDNEYESTEIKIDKNSLDQTYYYVFHLDSAYIKAGGELKYYLEVSDNDRINGYKRSKTGTYSFRIPSADEIANEIAQSNQVVQESIDQRIKEAQDIEKNLKELDERLKTKKELDWQDEKIMNDILEQKERLDEQIKQLKEQNEQNNQKQNQFDPQSQEIQQKMEQLQEIMDNVLDEETKRLYDELRQLMEEQADIEEFRNQIEEMKSGSENLTEDLERTLELFKKLQFDMELQNNLEDLEQAIEDQQKLQEETAKGEKNTDSLAADQQKEQEDVQQLTESLEELLQLNQDRKNPEALPEDLKETMEEITEDQQEAIDALKKEAEDKKQGETEEGNEASKQEKQSEQSQEQNQTKSGQQKASKAQQRAIDRMKDVKQSLSDMQSGMQMEQQQEDLQNLRDLVDNLVTLSFNQESLMNEFRDIRPSDPRFVDLSQQQLKIQDDSKIIQDSLRALSQRVFQISSFVLKELSDMGRQMDGTVEALKEKRVSQAVGKQQFTMTAINNLALLLDDTLQQMQEQMANQMGSGKGKGKEKNIPMSGLTELQKQLSEQIKEMKKTGQNGRQLSEQLAKMAAQQERLRNALENFETGLDGNKLGEKIDKLVEQMELNEMDLLNKNISEETIERQRDIITRMLDAENAIEQRGEEEKREAQTAFEYELSVPESMLEYLKQKEKEVDLLKTIPTKLNPYYKKETNKYFNKIKNKE